MNKLQLIDADTLYYKPLAHPKMLIDGVLSDGLAILAGDSKIGKSWMVLWLCLQISRGEAVWGLPTRKTDVVYLALEDREWRVQQRMQELTDSPPENLRFGFSCGQLGAELEGQIEETLREFPSTGLIFLDTLQMVRDNASAKVNAYAQDYKDLSGLKKLADDHGICIFVVHHTRKERDNSNKDAFAEWIWKDPDRREAICKTYNILFNSNRPREYDGSHINFSGMNPEITLRKHQVNAIAHILYGGNTLLAHVVGAGKTFEMVAAAMESKRLGL